MKDDPDLELRIFTEAVKASRQERGALLERLCGSDRELLGKVEKLLRAHDRLGNFMEEPLIEDFLD